MERHKIKSAYDGLDIGFAVTRPKTEPKAVLQLVHGMCGCKERFEPIMEYLSANGVACITSDLRGHGESIKSLDDLGYIILLSLPPFPQGILSCKDLIFPSTGLS